MQGTFSITINRREFRVPANTSVAAAMIQAGEPSRFSVTGEARGPLCGMGVCMECRAIVNGIPHVRTCLLVCTPGMEVITG